MTKRDRNCGENTGGRGADGKFGPGNPGNPGKRENELMAKPKVNAKPKSKPKITAKEKAAREHRRAFERICDFIISGARGESVREIAADRSVGIGRTKFYTMLQVADRDLTDRYARARRAQTDRMVEDLVGIADDAGGDLVVVRRKGCKGDKIGDFEIKGSPEMVHRAQLRIKTRQWVAAKLNPKVYGERQTVDINNGIQELNNEDLLARAEQLANILGITLPANLLKPARHRSSAD